jgi:hypothetical protein
MWARRRRRGRSRQGARESMITVEWIQQISYQLACKTTAAAAQSLSPEPFRSHRDSDRTLTAARAAGGPLAASATGSEPRSLWHDGHRGGQNTGERRRRTDAKP